MTQQPGSTTTIDRSAGVPTPDNQYSSFVDYFKDPLKTYRDEKKQAEKDMQSRIDDINVRYDAQVRAEREAGQQDLGRQRSMNLRAGLGGSDFGAANKAAIRDRTNANVATIDANRDIAVSDAIDKIEALALQRAQVQQQAMSQGFTSLLQYDQFNMEMKQASLESIRQLGESGLDMQTIKKRDPQLYNELVVASGLGEVQAEAVMNHARTQAQKIDYTYQVVGNKVIGYGIDPVTGTLKQVSQELDVEIPKNYSATFAPDGTMMLVPEQFDPSLPPESQVKIVGNYAKPETSSGSGLELLGLSGTESLDQLVSNPIIQAHADAINEGKYTMAQVDESLRNLVGLALARGDTGTQSDEESSRTLTQVGLLNDSLTNAYNLAGASGTGAIVRTAGDAFVGDTDFRRLETYVNTIKSNLLVLQTDPNIKKFFGPQMSNYDVQAMMAAGSNLDVYKQSPEDLRAELDRVRPIIQRLNSIAIQKATPQLQAEQLRASTEVGQTFDYNGVTYIKLGDNAVAPASQYMSLMPSTPN